MKPLIEFIESKHMNAWLAFGHMDVYVRKGNHYINGEFVPASQCFDVASVEVVEKYQGKGQFKTFLRTLRDILPRYGFRYLYIENLLNERLEAFLIREGFTYQERSVPPSYWELLRNPD